MSINDLFSFIGIAFALLFPLVNPIGAVPAFSSLTANNTPDFRKAQARKSAINSTLILLIFLFIGHLLLELFGISIGVLRIAGGLIVGNAAWQMVTAKDDNDAEKSKIQNVDISFMPMAMPLLSGPGAIGAVIGLSFTAKDFDDYLGFVIGILLLGAVTYLFLITSFFLMKKLGKNGITVLTKMMGFFILAISVNLIYSGILDLIKKN